MSAMDRALSAIGEAGARAAATLDPDEWQRHSVRIGINHQLARVEAEQSGEVP
jgi:hypothetical protein